MSGAHAVAHLLLQVLVALKQDFVFDISPFFFEGRVLLNFRGCIKFPKALDQLFEVVLLLLKHDEARYSILVIN